MQEEDAQAQQATSNGAGATVDGEEQGVQQLPLQASQQEQAEQEGHMHMQSGAGMAAEGAGMTADDELAEAVLASAGPSAALHGALPFCTPAPVAAHSTRRAAHECLSESSIALSIGRCAM